MAFFLEFHPPGSLQIHSTLTPLDEAEEGSLETPINYFAFLNKRTLVFSSWEPNPHDIISNEMDAIHAAAHTSEEVERMRYREIIMLKLD